MASLTLAGDTSGQITLAAPAVAGTNTITLPAVTGTAVVAGGNSAVTSGTAVASTSGTAIDFTSIPAYAKRITVMFNGVSTTATSNYLLQIGAGSITTTGYLSSASSGATNSASTAAFILTTNNTTAAGFNSGLIILSNVSGNTWASSSNIASGAFCTSAGGNVTLAGVLDRVRLTTVNGTDTFDAGSINILWE